MSEGAPTGPLDGYRVIELGTLIAGPFAGKLLGDMGADVIKIESPDRPDPLRTWGQAEQDGHRFFWTVHARNKRCVTLDLRVDAGRDLFLNLIEHADVVVENFRPGTLEKWGLGFDVLSARNPKLVLARVSGYGQSGPQAKSAGYASVAEAVSGFRHLNGYPGRRLRVLPFRSEILSAGCSPFRECWRRCSHESGPAVVRWSTLPHGILSGGAGIHDPGLRSGRDHPAALGNEIGGYCAVQHLSDL